MCAQPLEDKLRVFISYSRKDSTFADLVVAALEARGLSPTIDTRDLPTLEDWRRELLGFIRTADAVVFIVSPNSISSPVCAWEVEQVTALNKRLAPIVLERVADDGIPEGIAKINYLFFDPPNDFNSQADKLATALMSDLVWVKVHTRLGELARRWNERGRSTDLLLRGPEIEEAERWIASRPRVAPEPTEAHRQLIATSRKATIRRQRYIVVGSLVAAFLALGLAGTAFWQRQTAIENGQRADEERHSVLRNQSQLLATIATQHLEDGDAASGMLFAIEGLQDKTSDSLSQRARPIEPKSVAALYSSLIALRESMVLPAALEEDRSQGLKARFSSSGRFIVVGNRILDLKVGGRPTYLDGSEAPGFSARPGPNDLVVIDQVAGVSIYNPATLEYRSLSTEPGLLSPDGNRIAPFSSPTRILQLDGKVVSILSGHHWTDSADDAGFSGNGLRFRDGCDVWDTNSGRRIFQGPIKTNNREEDSEPDQHCKGAILSWDGELILLKGNKKTTVFRVATGQELTNLSFDLHDAFEADDYTFSHDNAYLTVRFSPSDFRTTFDQLVALWKMPIDDNDTWVNEYPRFLTGHTNVVTRVAFDQKTKRVATAAEDGTVRIFDAENAVRDRIFGDRGPLISVLAGHGDAITSVEFSPDGTSILSAGRDGTLRLWRTGDLSEPIEIKDTELVGSVGLQARLKRGTDVVDNLNSNTLLVEGTTAIVKEKSSGKVLLSVDGRDSYLKDAALSPDGQILATAHGEQSGSEGEGAIAAADARLWDVQSGQLLAVLKHDLPVRIVAFTQDGRKLVTEQRNVWNSPSVRKAWPIFLSVPDLVSHAKDAVPRCLTPRQRKTWSLTPEPPSWCIDLAKWPYQTTEWKQWLIERRAGRNSPPPQ